jgi:hypothetical protein
MKYWKYSLWLGIFSFALLITSLLLPASYSVFIWKKFTVDAGILFPVLLVSWIAAVLAVAFNNIFVDEMYMYKKIEMKRRKKYLPSLLGLPGLISFVWFCYRWYRGNPLSQ